jgi:hypothetical protein
MMYCHELNEHKMAYSERMDIVGSYVFQSLDQRLALITDMEFCFSQ